MEDIGTMYTCKDCGHEFDPFEVKVVSQGDSAFSCGDYFEEDLCKCPKCGHTFIRTSWYYLKRYGYTIREEKE